MTDGQGSILDKIITTQQFSRKEHFRPQEILAEILKALSEREAQVLVRRFGLPDKDKETLERIQEEIFGFDVVFNLVESVAGTDRLGYLAPEIFQDIGIPYTGCPYSALKKVPSARQKTS